MKKLIVLAALVAGIPSSADVYRRQYKYYLDASRAEEVLAGIVIRPRLVDDEWLNIVGERREQTYSVRRGDTLWGIARREFNDASLWRKLWQVNAFLTNPHELEVGQILRYYMEGDKFASGGGEGGEEGMRIPLVKLLPGGFGKGFDLDQDSVFSRDIRNRYRPNLIVVTEKEVLGELTGAYTESEALGEHEEIYANFTRGDTVKIGDEFSIVRFERTLVDTTLPNRPAIGMLMRRVGEAKVTGFGEQLAKIEITGQSAIARRGDAIIQSPKVVSWSAFFNPPPELQARIVMGEEEDRRFFGQGEIVLLNKGMKDGIREGFLFRVYRDYDLRTKRTVDVEPSFKGEVQIVFASELASVGYILRSKDLIGMGDSLVPSQAFLNPPPPPQKSVQIIELQ